MNYTDIFSNHARNRPTHPAIADAQGVISYRELDPLVTATARRLAAAGIRLGDLVGVALPSSTEHLLVLCGLLRLGAVTLPIDPGWPAAEIAERLRKFEVPWLLTAPGAAAPEGVRAVAIDGGWRTPAAGGLPAPEMPDDDELPALLVLSSGTTGMPKGPLLSHRQMRERWLTGQVNWGLSPSDRYASVIPMCFNMGRANCLGTLSAGGTAVLFPDGFPMARAPEAFRRARVTWAFLTPMHLRQLLKLATGDRPLMPYLRPLIVATSPLTAGERNAARRRITPHFFEAFGSNECGLYATSSPADQIRRPDSVGRVIVGIEAEIVDDEHRPVPAGELGQIRLRGPGFPSAFFRNPEATAQSFRDGWFYPNDAAVIDAEGYVHLKGRRDDIINFDGVKIVPDDVEAALLTHPAVAEAAVVGHQNPARREFPVAFVVLKGATTPDELTEFCRTRLAVAQQPRAYVFVDALPKNELGKVLRRELRDKVPDLKPRQS